MLLPAVKESSLPLLKYVFFIYLFQIIRQAPLEFQCAKLDIPTSAYDSFLHCGKGHVGNALEGAMGQRTAALNPKHTFVPWVTFNGVGSETISYDAINDLVKSVCHFYTGPEKCPPTNTFDEEFLALEDF